jgi:hypothetical protein
MMKSTADLRMAWVLSSTTKVVMAQADAARSNIIFEQGVPMKRP